MEDDRARQIEYHYGFYAAIHFDYDIVHLELSFQQELELGDKPVRLDMLIVRRSRRRGFRDPIGQFLKRHNILEYKSPGKSLMISIRLRGTPASIRPWGRPSTQFPLRS